MTEGSDHGGWPGKAITVVVLPGGAQDDRLLELAEHWTSTRLLGPALWVRSTELQDRDRETDGGHLGAPPHLMATVIGRNGRAVVDLFEQLARAPFTLVRVVAVRVVLDDRRLHEQQDWLIDVMSRYIEDSQPGVQDLAGVVRRGTEIRKVNLIFAASEIVGAVPEPLLESGWTANLVVSPEDRPAPSRFDVFTRESDVERFDGFILANIATAGALWTGIDEAFYEGIEFAQPTDEVACIRTYVRAVLTDGLVLRVAARTMERVMDPEGLWASIDRRGSLQPVTGARAEQAVRELAQAAMNLDGSRLRYQPLPGLKPLEPRVIGLGPQLRQFSGFAWDKTVALPRWMVEDIRRFWSRVATRVFQGDSGRSRVEIGGEAWLDRADHQLLLDAKALALDKDEALQGLTAQYRAPGGERHPELWADLRRLALGALDGSLDPVAAGVPALDSKDDTARMIVGDPSLIVQSPAEGSVTQGDAPAMPVGTDEEGSALPWMSLEQAEHLERTMSHLHEARQSRIHEIRQSLSNAEAEFHEAATAAEDREFDRLDALENWEMVQDAEAEGASAPGFDDAKRALDEAEQLAAAASSRRAVAERTRDRLLKRLSLAEDRAQRAGEDLDGLRAWIASHNLSLAGQIDTLMREERSRLDRDVSDARTWLRSDPPFKDDHAETLRNSFRTLTRIGVLISVVVGVLGSLYTANVDRLQQRFPGIDWPDVPMWVWPTAALIIALVVYLIALVLYYRGWSQSRRALDEQRRRVDDLRQSAPGVDEERSRLDSLCGPMEDFWRLMALAIHRPWAGAEGLVEEKGKRPTVASLPACVRLAEPPTGSGSGQQSELEDRVAGWLLQPGWRSRSFDILCRAAEEVAAEPKGKFGTDALDRNYAAVRALARVLETGEAQEIAGQRTLLGMASQLEGAWVADQRPEVQDLRLDPLARLDIDPNILERSSTTSVGWDAHLSEILGPGCPWSPLVFTDEALSRNAAAPFVSFAHGPSRLQPSFAPGPQAHPEPEAYVVVDQASTGAIEIVVRVDMSDRMDAGSFAVFSTQMAPVREDVTEVVESPAAQGLFARRD